MNSFAAFTRRNVRGKVLIDAVDIGCEADHGLPSRKVATTALRSKSGRYVTVKRDFEPGHNVSEAVFLAQITAVDNIAQEYVQKLSRCTPALDLFDECIGRIIQRRIEVRHGPAVEIGQL